MIHGAPFTRYTSPVEVLIHQANECARMFLHKAIRHHLSQDADPWSKEDKQTCLRAYRQARARRRILQTYQPRDLIHFARLQKRHLFEEEIDIIRAYRAQLRARYASRPDAEPLPYAEAMHDTDTFAYYQECFDNHYQEIELLHE